MSWVPAMLPQELIRKKRDGGALSADEIRAFIAGVTDDSIPAYQVAAMLMAVYFRGLDDRELAVWADAMVHSGDVVDLGAIDARKVDLVLTCPVGPERRRYVKKGEDSFFVRLERGQTPSWLGKVTLPPALAGSFRLYRVIR